MSTRPFCLLIAPLIAVSVVTLGDAQELVDRIVGVVEKDPIFMSDVDDAMTELLYLRRVRGEPMPADSEEVAAIRADLLDSIIERRIVIAKARKLGIEITRTEVEDALDQWLADLVRTSGSEAAFERELERQGMTLKDLKALYRKDIEEQLLVSRFMRQEFSYVTVSEGEIKDFFDTKYDSIPEVPETVGLAHIIIIPKMSGEREANARERVDRIMARVSEGEPFERVARETSDDVLTRTDGGRIGTLALEDLQEDLARIASGLDAGQVSNAVRTRYGFEIVRLDAKEGNLYTLSHILVGLRPDQGDTLRAARLAHEIQARAAQGESFESLAKQYSDDTETRDNGGYVGEIDISALDDAYREGLSDLEPGGVSDVLTTPHGFQILKLVSKTAGRKPGLDEAREWIRSVIEARKREGLFTEWLDEAKQEIYVKRMEF